MFRPQISSSLLCYCNGFYSRKGSQETIACSALGNYHVRMMIFDDFFDVVNGQFKFKNPFDTVDETIAWCFEFPCNNFETAKFSQAIHPGNGVGAVRFSKKEDFSFFHFMIRLLSTPG